MSANWGTDLLNKLAAEEIANQDPAEEEAPDEPQEPDETGPDEEPEEEPEGPETPEEQGEEEPETPAPSADAWTYDDGLRIDRDQARIYAEFEQFLINNPQVAQAISQTIGAQGEPAKPEPQAPAVPEGLDLDDPAVRALWNELVAQRDLVARANETLQRHESQLTQQNQSTTESLINNASLQFAKDHDLSETEMKRVRDTAGRLQVLPALISPTDPITGVPRKVDPMAAIQEAFNIAYWQLPELREREMQRLTKKQRDDRKRKGKLAALGGTSGSVPRQVNVPNDPAARRQAMIAEIAGMMETPS